MASQLRVRKEMQQAELPHRIDWKPDSIMCVAIKPSICAAFKFPILSSWIHSYFQIVLCKPGPDTIKHATRVLSSKCSQHFIFCFVTKRLSSLRLYSSHLKYAYCKQPRSCVVDCRAQQQQQSPQREETRTRCDVFIAYQNTMCVNKQTRPQMIHTAFRIGTWTPTRG